MKLSKTSIGRDIPSRSAGSEVARIVSEHGSLPSRTRAAHHVVTARDDVRIAEIDVGPIF